MAGKRGLTKGFRPLRFKALDITGRIHRWPPNPR
jgi:hypothetical protein